MGLNNRLVMGGIALALLLVSAAKAETSGSLRKAFPKLDVTRVGVILSEIHSGGVSRDGIPAILDPQFLPVSEVTGLGDDEPVIFLTGTCGAFAFPYRVLLWHEIVHHDQCGLPVAVTFCPLCNTSMVFDRRIDGMTLSFGTSGRLRHSDLVMYDHQTESLWQQFTGEAIVGTHLGKSLSVVPARIEAWRIFREEFPQGQVLVPPSWGRAAYGTTPYEGYDKSLEPFLYSGKMPRELGPLVRVVRIGTRAWSLPYVRKHSPVVTRDGLRITWTEGQNSVMDRQSVRLGRDIGNVRVTREGADIAFSVDFAFAYRAFYPEGELVK